VVGSNDMIVC